MKKWLSVLLVLCLLFTTIPLGTLPVGAATSGYYTYSVSDGKATITAVNTSISGDVTVPSTLGGYPVTSIGLFSFYKCYSITSVTIPDSVTRIEHCAFQSCTGLTSVTIPDSVMSIGDNAFTVCSSLTSISIPDSVTSIGHDAFAACRSLTSVTILDGVMSIGPRAFNSCESLTNITVSGANAVYCSHEGVLFNKDKTILICYPAGKATTSYVIPESVTGIEDHAFEECAGLTSVTIGNSVTSIGMRAFYGCSSLTDVWYEGSKVQKQSMSIDSGNKPLTDATWYYEKCINTEIHTYSNTCDSSCNVCGAIRDVPGHTYDNNGDADCNVCGTYRYYTYTVWKDATITDVDTAISGNVTIPSTLGGYSVTTIGESAFYGCSSVTSVIIPDSVTSIGAEAFEDCTGLTSVTIGNSVTSIGYSAFEDCFCLSKVYYRGSETQKQAIWIGSYNTSLDSATWYYNSCIGSATHIYKWVVDRAETCGAAGKKHEKCTLCGAIRNEGTVVPATGNHTYSHVCDKTCNVCGDVRDVEHTFEWVIDREPTCGKVGLKHELCTRCGTVQSANTKIPSPAHTYDNTYDMECNICSTSRATGKCGTNASWRLENGVLTIGGSGRIASYSGFRHTPWAAYKDQITTVRIGNDIISIGSYAFAAMGSLQTVVFEEGSVLQALRSHVFHYCSNLKSVVLPDTVVDIDYSAFGYCPKLTYVYMPECAVTLYKGIFVESPNVVLDVVETYTAYNYAVKNNIKYVTHEPTVPTGLALPGEQLLYSGTCGENLTWKYYYSGKLIIEGSGKMDSYSYLTKMPWYEFRNDVRSVWIDKDITEIGVYSLATLFNLNRVVFEEGSQLTTIRDHAFHYCSALKSIVLPEKVTQLEYAALGYCLQIENIYVPESATVIYANAFIGSNLDNVVLSVASGSTAERYANKNGIKYEVR